MANKSSDIEAKKAKAAALRAAIKNRKLPTGQPARPRSPLEFVEEQMSKISQKQPSKP